MKPKRRLIYVPIVHTSVDMGTLAPDMRRAYSEAHGTSRWVQHEGAIADFWRGLAVKVGTLNLNGTQARVYQDGLPVCGRELPIVAELAQRGSPNHLLVLELVRRGARLEGTEETEALVEEYRLVKTALEIVDVEERDRFAREKAGKRDELLKRRDAFIARRIDETLKPGEVGILFIGMVHDVTRFLPRDIEIEYLIYRLPFRSGAVGKESPYPRQGAP